MAGIPARLSSFAIIHNGLACEDESATNAEATEKIIFYHPATDEPRARLNHLSLCEGLIAFSRTLNPHANCTGENAADKSRFPVTTWPGHSVSPFARSQARSRRRLRRLDGHDLRKLSRFSAP
jgi:hypothetical protein